MVKQFIDIAADFGINVINAGKVYSQEKSRVRDRTVSRGIHAATRGTFAGPVVLTKSSFSGPAASANTQVSLLPPPCEELTTSEPFLSATRVRPPGRTKMSLPHKI